MRDRVFQRAGYQCQFTGPDGTRCTARTGLEIEHRVPFAMRPGHDEPFRQLLAQHFQQDPGGEPKLRAEQAYGARYVQTRIAMRRLQPHGFEPEDVPDGELLGDLEAKRGEVGCCDPVNFHC